MDPQKPRRDPNQENGSPGLRAPVEGESSSSNVPLPPDQKTPPAPRSVPLDPEATYVPLDPDATLVPLDPEATYVDLDATLVDLPRSPVPRQTPRPPVSGLFVSAAVLQTGDVLAGRYEILQLLGEGGMGAVYKARDRELDRFVALKLIRPELASNPAILARFKQELLLAHQVTHRNVIRIYDLGEGEGVKFITMEYIEGEDLRRLILDHGKFSAPETVEIIRQTCYALHAAHSVGVIHRDLKPQNIMRDKTGRILVMDFGLARSVQSEGMTQTGALVGTMEYMSPEQAMGSELDQRSDLFAVGLIFFELLTCKMPYKADTALASLLKRNQERAIPAVDLEPTIPKGVSDIVAKCLERDLKARYQNVQEILDDLDAWAGKRPVSASMIGVAPSPSAIGTAPSRQMPWKWVAIGTLAVALGATGWIFRGKLPIGAGTKATQVQVTSLAILPFHNASNDPNLDWLGSSLAETLSTDVGQSASLRMVSPERLHQVLRDLQISPGAELDLATLKQLQDSSNVQTVVSGQYVKVGDQIRIEATLKDLKADTTTRLAAATVSEKDPLAVDSLAKEIRENVARSSGSSVQELQAQAFRPSSTSVDALRSYNEGLELARQGNNLEAQKKFEAATQADPEFALAFSRLAQSYASLGYDNEAERYSRRAVELSQSLPATEKFLIQASNARISNDTDKAISSYENLAKAAPQDTDIQFALATLYEDSNDYDKAKQHLQKVLEQDGKNADALLASGRVEIKSGKPQNGLDSLNKALTQANLAKNREEQAAILQATGVAYRLMNRPEDALKNYQDSLEIKKQIGDKRGIAVSLNEMAQANIMLGKPDAALASYNDALKIRREIGDKRGVADTLNDLANFYLDSAKPDQALGLYKEALQINRDLGDEANQAMILNNIGSAYSNKGQYQDAQTYFQQALQLREKLKVPDDIAETVRNLAATDTRLGDYDQALAQYLKALGIRRDSGDKRDAAITSYDMGTAFGFQGRFAAALKSRREALQTFQALGDKSYWMAEILSGYGHSLAQAGRGDEAQQSFNDSLALARDLKNESLVSQLLRFQGDAAAYRGDFKGARALYDQALQSATAAKDSENILLARLALAHNDVQQAHWSAAISSLKPLIQQSETQGLKYEALQGSLDLGEALINTKALPQARQELERAQTRSEKLGTLSLQARAEYLLATVYRLSGNNSLAIDHYREALRLLNDIRKEAENDKILQRADFAAIITDAKRYTS